ncbi:MAG: hypothetical protein AAF211_27105, partial [Myxococcota bacterium]
TRTLTIEMSSSGDRTVGGSEQIRLLMMDETEDRIEVRSINAGDPTTVTYANGLTLTLSAGDIFKDDRITIDVSVDEGTTVDPDAALNGTGAASARLEDGHTIVAGSFDVQGVSIAVDPSDTIHDVLQRITDSAAGVDATFDAASDAVRLTRRNTLEETVVIDNDTSGLIAALKLDSATAVVGNTPDQEQVMSSVAGLASVSSGSITVNGTSVAFDVTVDTLEDVLGRIEDEADVGVSLTGASVSLTARNGQDLTLSDGGTGLLDALELQAGTVKAVRGSGPDRQETMEAMKEFVRTLDELMQAASSVELAPTVLVGLRDEVESLFREAEGGSDRAHLRTAIGLDLDFRDDAREIVSLRSNGRAMERLLARDRFAVQDFFGIDQGDGEGLLDRLLDRLKTDKQELRSMTGTSTGLMVSVWA